MKTHAVTFTLFIFSLGLLATPSFGQSNHNWINPAGGEFSQPANWDNGVPGATDKARFQLIQTYSVEIVAPTEINDYLQLLGNVTLTGDNTLTTESASISGGTLNLSGLNQLHTGSMNLNESTTVNINDNSQLQATTSLDVGSITGTGVLAVNNQGEVNSGSVTRVGAFENGAGTIQVTGSGAKFQTRGMTLGVASDGVSDGGVGMLDVTPGAHVVVGHDFFYSDFFIVSSSSNDGTLVARNGSQINSGQAVIGGLSGRSGLVTLNGAGTLWTASSDVYVGDGGSGILEIEQGASFSGQNVKVGDRSVNSSSIQISGLGSRMNATDLTVGEDLRVGSVEIATGSTAAVAGTTLIEDGSQVVLSGGRFEFGQLSASSYSRINGSSGNLNGAILLDAYNDISGMDFSIANLDTTEVQINNSGVIYGNGASSLGVSNFSGAEIRTLNGEWMRFDGGVNTNAGEINNFNGTIEFGGPLINEAGGFIGGRGQFIAGGGTTNYGVMAFSAGNADVLGDVVSASGGQIVTSGFGVTTFFDDVQHNGAEIRTANGSASVFLGGVTGAGSFTGAGDVFFEGDLRPGNSPDIVSFEGNVFLGSGAFTSIELAGLAIGEFDMLDIEGDLSLDGSLDVSMLDGFTLGFDQEFLFADVGGLVTGQFDFLGEGDLVGNFGGRDLFISYAQGNGNDIGLFTASVPEPGTAAFMGFAFIGLMFRRRRKDTPIKSVKIRSSLLAMLVIATVSSSAATASADVIVTSRHSLGAFDVFGVYPGEFQRRNVSDESTSLTGMFTMSESFDAVVTNGFATGIYDHTDNVVNTNSELNITSTSSMEGSATQGVDAVASSSIVEFIHVNFTVTGEGANYSMTGDFDPADASGDSIYLTESFGGLDAFRYTTAQAFDVSGTLAAGDYTFRVNNGSATNDNNGYTFSGGHDFALNITSVPEPGSLVVLGLLGSMVGMVRRRRRTV